MTSLYQSEFRISDSTIRISVTEEAFVICRGDVIYDCGRKFPSLGTIAGGWLGRIIHQNVSCVARWKLPWNLARKSKGFHTLTILYLLTPWCRVLLENLNGLQLVKKFPSFHGTRRFINALTSVRHLSLSWANPIQSIYPHPTSWRSILILSTHLGLGLPNGLLPSGFPTKTLYTPLSNLYVQFCANIS